VSLTVTKADIERAIARNLGYTSGALPATEQGRVDDAINMGLREFYMPRRVAPDQPFHVWSFLLKPLSLATVAGESTIDLPADFSLLHRGLTYSADSGHGPMALVPEDEIRALQSRDGASGVPRYASVRYKTSSTYELVLYPTPDKEYTISGRYRFEPGSLSLSSSTPLGGVLHAETILLACLVGSDMVVNPELGESKYEQRFQQLLSASVEQDKALMANMEADSWPLEFEAGDSLNVTKGYLKALIGKFLGYGGNPNAWSHTEESQAAESLRAGLRRFYDPSILPGERYKHHWSFLKPVLYIDLVGAQQEYSLPEDFAILDGPLSYAPGTAVLYDPIHLVGEERIRDLSQTGSTAARPMYYAIRVGQDADVNTSYKMVFWPIPDQEYTVTGRYRINPFNMADDARLPLGGQPHAQTIIEACLASAEISQGGEGIHNKKFLECLASSISHDRQVNSPDTVGYDYDNSHRRYGYKGRFGNWHDLDENIVTHNGIRY